MLLRSFLFVPADRPDRFVRAMESGADAVIFDLEDSVAPDAKDVARNHIRTLFSTPAQRPRFVRINPLHHAMLPADISAAQGADGLVLPKAEGADDVRALTQAWDEYASQNGGLPCPPVLPIATETPAALFRLGSYGEVAASLYGLTWGAEDLPAAIGATTAREADGRYTPPYEMVRSLALLAAHAAQVAAIETIMPTIDDPAGLRAYAERGARDGFTGMLAIHPAQIAIINAAFTPSAEAVAHAERIIDAFAKSPGAGVLQVDGKMVDAPHLKQARAIMERARAQR